ncbi:MAG: nucleotidyltransferase family protein [Calditrichia bacterium]
MKKNLSITTAILLAAGFGTRMENLTAHTPKPLLKIAGYSLLEISLLKLQAAGFKKVVINLHYLGDQIIAHLKGKSFGLEICFSHENDILGTGGGIALAEKYFKPEETILCLNVDVLSDLSILEFIESYQSAGGIAGMAVKPSTDTARYSLALFNEKNQLRGFLPKGGPIPENLQSGIFTGFQLLSPRARHFLRPVFSSVISDFYELALQQQKPVHVYLHKGIWLDVGTKAQYLHLNEKAETDGLDMPQFTGRE